MADIFDSEPYVDEDADNAPEAEEMSEDAVLETVRRMAILATRPEINNTNERQDAIYYYTGDLDLVSDERDTIPRIPGRSSVTALTLAETLETMIPVIMDIITDKETIAFRRRKGEPVQASRDETDAAYSIIYEDNDGWQAIHDAVWDAGVSRSGAVVCGVGQDNDGKPCVTIESVDPDDVLYVPTARSADYSPYWGVVWRLTKEDFAERFQRDPDDFSAAPQSFTTRDATQNSYSVAVDTDNVGVIQHYLKQPKGYVCITTDYGVSEVLDTEEFECLPVIWFTMYKRPHSLVGWSVHDRTKGPQKIETILQRAAMDNVQFAQTNRPVIDINKILPETIGQLATDAPSVPIMVKGEGAITPLYQSQGMPFDVFGMYEKNAADVEARAGVGRNMQGVNAEALHESASVGMQMENRQQMRVRTIARHIAEGPMRKLFECVHYIARSIGASVDMPVLGSEDIRTIDASQWQPLRGVTAIVDVKGGSEALQLQAQTIRGVVTDLTSLQGGPVGQFIEPKNILAAAGAILSAAGVSNPTDYVPAEPIEMPPPAPPPPDPAVVKIQADAEYNQKRIQLDAEKAAADAELKKRDTQAKRDQAILEDNYKRDQADAELALRREQLAAELQLKREQMQAEIQLKREQMAMDAHNHQAKLNSDAELTSNVDVGGEPG